jgi:hypothetical protein
MHTHNPQSWMVNSFRSRSGNHTTFPTNFGRNSMKMTSTLRRTKCTTQRPTEFMNWQRAATIDMISRGGACFIRLGVWGVMTVKAEGLCMIWGPYIHIYAHVYTHLNLELIETKTSHHGTRGFPLTGRL